MTTASSTLMTNEACDRLLRGHSPVDAPILAAELGARRAVVLDDGRVLVMWGHDCWMLWSSEDTVRG